MPQYVKKMQQNQFSFLNDRNSYVQIWPLKIVVIGVHGRRQQ